MDTWYRFLLKLKFRTNKYKLNFGRFIKKFSLKDLFLCLFILSSIAFICLHILQENDINNHYNRFVYVYEKNVLHNNRNFYRGHLINKTKLKYILIWKPGYYTPFLSPEGQQRFMENKCEYQNCFVTGDKKYLPNVTEFDAIIFNVRHMQSFRSNDVPIERSPKQIYIFYAVESAEYFPVCDKEYDEFFNWTMTYRLDSDIPVTYFEVLDKSGKVIAPKLDVKWKNLSGEIPRFLAKRLCGKYKPVAWFVSNCLAKSERWALATLLRETMVKYYMDLDIYGKCGELSCPITQQENCDRMLRNDYFFYLAFENSYVLDYVTEKVLLALDNDVLPIVFGGSDYSKFLPPNSYIDVMNFTDDELASKLNELITHPKQYWKYFRWKSHYVIRSANASNICSLCAALNDQNMYRNSVHKYLRLWWHRVYEKRCPIVIPNNFSDYADDFKKLPVEYHTQPGLVAV